MPSVNAIYSNLSKPEYINFKQTGGAKKTAAQIKRERTKYGLFSDLAYKLPDQRADVLRKYDKTGHWKLDAELSNRDAAVFRSAKTGEVVVAVRGTDPVSKDTRYRDIATDLGIAFGVSKFGKRNKEITSIVDKAAKKYDTPPTLSGHSLGGRVAGDVARKRGLKAVVYNAGASPVDWIPNMFSRIGKLMGRKQSKADISHHRTRYDPVSVSKKLGAHDEQLHEIDPANKASAHSLSTLLPEKDSDERQIGLGRKKRRNRWLDHVRKYRAKHPEISYRDALKKASATYKR